MAYRRRSARSGRTLLRTLPGVQSVHDVHVWAMSTSEIALTAHLVIPWRDCPPSFLASLEHELAERFSIAHVTVQIDPPDSTTAHGARQERSET